MYADLSSGRPSGPCLLVFPPVWEVAAPYLATPALAAYLRTVGQAAVLLDANHWFWMQFKQREKARRIYALSRTLAQDPRLELDEAAAADAVSGMSPEGFSDWMQQAPLSSPLYRLVVRRFGGFWRAVPRVGGSLNYFDGYFSDISHSFEALHSKDLRSCITEDERHPWRAFAREEVLPRIANQQPSVLGLSIVAANQVVPALAIVVEARHAWPALPIVLGGAWVTQLRDRLSSLHWLASLGVRFVLFQGEVGLADLVSRIRSSAPSGLSHASVGGSGGKGLAVVRSPEIPIVSLPTPEFDGLELNKYAAPGHLPLMASRGCYWAKCRFCSYPVLEPKYESRPDRLLAGDLRCLVDRYAAHHVAFGDPSISPSLAQRIAGIIERENLSVTWGGFARLEPGFTRDVLRRLAEAGCCVLHWGLESGSQVVQERIGKGVRVDVASRVLQDAADVGIHNRVLLMYGLPKETSTDLQATLDFVEDRLTIIGSACWTRYIAEPGTPFGDAVVRAEPIVCAPGSLALGVQPRSLIPNSELADAEIRMVKLTARAGQAGVIVPA